MTKLPINPVKIYVKLYDLVNNAVERGVDYGYNKAFKHEISSLTDTQEIYLKDIVARYVMNEICEIIDFDQETKND
jgi:hypothetical protein